MNTIVSYAQNDKWHSFWRSDVECVFVAQILSGSTHTYGYMLEGRMCSVLRRLHCWPHKCTSRCSCRCGFWSAALLSGDLQTKESFRMCSQCESTGSVVRLRQIAHSKTGLVALRLLFLFCFHLQHTGLKGQILSFRFKCSLSGAALDLRSQVETHSVLRLVACFHLPSSMHILEVMNPGMICSGAKPFRPSPRHLPPSI